MNEDIKKFQKVLGLLSGDLSCEKVNTAKEVLNTIEKSSFIFDPMLILFYMIVGEAAIAAED